MVVSWTLACEARTCTLNALPQSKSHQSCTRRGGAEDETVILPLRPRQNDKGAIELASYSIVWWALRRSPPCVVQAREHRIGELARDSGHIRLKRRLTLSPTTPGTAMPVVAKLCSGYYPCDTYLPTNTDLAQIARSSPARCFYLDKSLSGAFVTLRRRPTALTGGSAYTGGSAILLSWNYRPPFFTIIDYRDQGPPAHRDCKPLPVVSPSSSFSSSACCVPYAFTLASMLPSLAMLRRPSKSVIVHTRCVSFSFLSLVVLFFPFISIWRLEGDGVGGSRVNRAKRTVVPSDVVSAPGHEPDVPGLVMLRARGNSCPFLSALHGGEDKPHEMHGVTCRECAVGHVLNEQWGNGAGTALEISGASRGRFSGLRAWIFWRISMSPLGEVCDPAGCTAGRKGSAVRPLPDLRFPQCAQWGRWARLELVEASLLRLRMPYFGVRLAERGRAILRKYIYPTGREVALVYRDLNTSRRHHVLAAQTLRSLTN
ncbi:hypothetical protein DFH06DRAFT_1319230 [Mycena polygramma]|nr:hypothetical protein DFH06DRAFT_1319230 [Mycena polygramma]